MEKVDFVKIINEKVISRINEPADEQTKNDIITFLTTEFEKNEVRVFKNKITSDQKIDFFMDCKGLLLGVIKTKIKTKSYEYYLYNCAFLDEDLINKRAIFIMNVISYNGEMADLDKISDLNDLNIIDNILNNLNEQL